MSTESDGSNNAKSTGRLRTHFIFALLGNMGYVVFQYLTLAVFVKFYSSDEVGIYHYSTAFVVPLALSFDLQLRSLFITESNPGRFNSYWNYRRILNPISLVIIVVAALLFKSEFIGFIAALGVLKVIENQTNLIYGLYHRTEGMRRVAVSRWLRSGVGFVVVLTLAITIKPDFLWLIYAYAVAGLLVYLVYDLRWANTLRRKLEHEAIPLKSLVILTIPMLFIALIEKYYVNYPRLIIEEYFGLEIIGIIGSLFYLRMMGSQVISALSITVQGRFGEYLEKGNQRALEQLMYKSMLGGFAVGGVLTLLFWMLGTWILPILFTEEYNAYVPELLWILVGSGVLFGYTFLGGAINALRLHRWKIPVQAVAFAVLIGLSMMYHADAIQILQWVVLSEVIVLIGYILVFYIGRSKRMVSQL